MTVGASEQEQRHGITSALQRAGLTLEELWLRYFALGGSVGLVELEAYLQDLMPLPVGQRDMLAHAVNERLSELAPPAPAPYSRALRQGPPRDGPRTPAAELIRSLLPPPAAESAGVSVAGLVEPATDVGGDAFDYALSSTSVALAVFDGTGHGLAAALTAAAALAALRAVRCDGRGLDEQARAVDEVIAEQLGDALLGGVLAELDLTSGALRYVAAGHAHPLLLRRGQVVTSLTGGRRTPFGLDSDDLALGEEQLEPGDWLVLHSDGVTGARDPDGASFGEHRLVDLLEREADSGQLPAETVRRLMDAVLAHRNGVLQDDATLLLARWDAGDRTARGGLTA